MVKKNTNIKEKRESDGGDTTINHEAPPSPTAAVVERKNRRRHRKEELPKGRNNQTTQQRSAVEPTIKHQRNQPSKRRSNGTQRIQQSNTFAWKWMKQKKSCE